MPSITRSTLLAAQAAAAALRTTGYDESDRELFAFGGDDDTRKRLEALTPNPSVEDVMTALDVPVELRQYLIDFAGGEVSLASAGKALEAIQSARRDAAKERMWAKQQEPAGPTHSGHTVQR